MKIIDTHGLLTPSQNAMLQADACKSFNLGKFSSLDDILTKLNVIVTIQPGIQVRKMPAFFDDLEKHWDKLCKELELKITPGDKESWNRYNDAIIALKDIRISQNNWTAMALRGYYDSDKKEIVLFPEEMKTEYDGNRVDELLISTLAHETMHAFFDRPKHKQFPYVSQIEEPLAEFGMLMYLNVIDHNCYRWAYNDVKNKKTFYRYGAILMDQCISENYYGNTRRYLENYKIRIPGDSMCKISANGNTISLPEQDKRNTTPQINGNIKRLYSVNGSGTYLGYQVIEEYIKFRLDKNHLFTDIQDDIYNKWKVGTRLLDTNITGVKLGSGRNKNPHIFTYKGVDYYVSKELKDKDCSHNIWKFRNAVNDNETDFYIQPIDIAAPEIIPGFEFLFKGRGYIEHKGAVAVNEPIIHAGDIFWKTQHSNELAPAIELQKLYYDFENQPAVIINDLVKAKVTNLLSSTEFEYDCYIKQGVVIKHMMIAHDKISVHIPASCDDIHVNTHFYDISITVDNNNKNFRYDSVNKVLINMKENSVICGLHDSRIPDGTTKIGHMAFYGCTWMKSIEIPNSVSAIESSAFDNCKSLKEIRVPKGMKTKFMQMLDSKLHSLLKD